ncbi:hypothetical protein AAEU32_14290 [Pseudoalteromonas sp. SSDWG2]|uniref:hypothetical protein n=1 Tax=Pseudoalteromonas sp. SSDWG2 TaxID=3139391 RepID=UPI003BA90FE0
MNKYLVPASLILLTTVAVPAIANNGVNVQALKACSMIENDFRRLLCYDNVVAGEPIDAQRQKSKGEGKGKNKEKNLPEQAAPRASAATAAEHKADDFGLEHKQIEENSADELVAKVTKVKEAPYGELIITLDNGQVWRQQGAESFILKSGDTVVISRAMFNSFLLKKQGLNKSIRVKRTD